MVFPQEIRQADQVAAFLRDVTADIDTLHEAAAAQVAKMGLKALELAADLRKAFDLPKRELVFGTFDVRKTLKNKRQNDQDTT